MKWFMHQSQAHRDTKLKKVLIRYGAEGYGLYWYCIEHICADVDPKLTFELEHDTEILAHELKIDTLKVQEMLVYMINLGLFEISDNIIYCMKLARYLGDKNTRNPDLKAIIQDQKSVNVPDRPRPSPTCPRQSALEERRGEESNNNTSPPNGDDTAKRTPFKKITDLYHEILPDLPAVKTMNSKRQAAMRQRHAKFMNRSLDGWRDYFQSVAGMDFLMGRIAGKDWRADFDFLLTEKAMTGVLEGKYSNRAETNEIVSYL